MKQGSIDIRFEGSKFYPSKLKQKLDLPIEILAEYGEIAANGRYKGLPSPYGMGLLEISSEEMDTNDLLREYSIKLKEWKTDLSECGVDEIIIDIENSNDALFEVSLSKDIMNSLILMNASIEFHATGNTKVVENRSEKIKNVLNILKKEELYTVLLNNLQKHPFLLKDENLPYLLYFFTTKNFSDNLNENLNNFEAFTRKVIQTHI